MKSIFIWFLFIQSCNDNEFFKLENNEGITRKFYKTIDGYVVKELHNDMPNGRFIYFSKENRIKKIEWYTHKNKPYYSFERDEFKVQTNDKFIEGNLDTSYLVKPKIYTTRFSDNSVKIVMFFKSPISLCLIKTYGNFPKVHEMDIFEDAEIFESQGALKDSFIYMGFIFINENNTKIYKTIDSVKVEFSPFIQGGTQ